MQNKMEKLSNHKKTRAGKDKKKISSISFSNPETLKDLPDNPDVKYSRNKILYGEFIKKSKSNL